MTLTEDQIANITAGLLMLALIGLIAVWVRFDRRNTDRKHRDNKGDND